MSNLPVLAVVDAVVAVVLRRTPEEAFVVAVDDDAVAAKRPSPQVR